MKNVRLVVLILAFGAASLALSAEMDQGQGANPGLTTAVIERTLTYQGILKNSSGNPVPDAYYEVTFRFYDIAVGGVALWNSGPLPVTPVDGYFTKELGPIPLNFDRPYYLSLQVYPDAEMTARQKVTMSPYSAVSDTANCASTISDNSVTSAKIEDGSIQLIDISGYGASDGQVIKWFGYGWGPADDEIETGNWNLSETVLSTNGQYGLAKGFSQNKLYGSVESHVNFGWACTTGVVEGAESFVTIGGGALNVASGNMSTISGGFSNNTSGYGFVGGGQNNEAGIFAAIAGGTGNQATGNGSMVGGGSHNAAIGQYSTVSGGNENIARVMNSIVSGGGYNTAEGDYAFIGGGFSNEAAGDHAAIGGGHSNLADSQYAFVGGGQYNRANGNYSVVGGGQQNLALATYSTIVGGIDNGALGQFAFIGGGQNNDANETYSTIGGGVNNQSQAYGSTIAGGVANWTYGMYSAIPGGRNDSLGPAAIYSMVFGRNVYCNDDYRVVFFDSLNEGCVNINRDGRNAWVTPYPLHIGTHTFNGNGAYLTMGGTWTNGSSRTFKENFTPYDGAELLSKISSLSLTSYNYINSTEKHFGPVAEEFVQAFDTGVIRESDGKRDNMYLSSGDVAGVALAGVQELLKQNLELKSENENMKSKLLEIEKRLSELEAR